ncbi:MAG: metal-dependent hydrolase [Alistipes sp.]|nr:metal-dependent hydrolase [Alistipes sp.]
MKIDFKTVKRVIAMLVVMPMLALAVACGDDPTSENGGETTGGEGEKPGTGGDNTEKYEDIKVVGGKVRFYLSEKENSTRTATNLSARDWAKSSVIMNGKTYEVALTEEATPRPYVEVDESSSYTASLITASSSRWYGGSTYADIKLTHSQIYHTSASNIKSFPMYASYSKETGNKLIFNDGFAMVVVKLKGSAKISSVKVENPLGKAISGVATFMPSKGYFTVKKGFDFVAMNCTNKGEFVALTSTKESYFRLMIAPGNYTEGLKVTICDADHGAMFVATAALNLSAGDVHTITADYTCDKDLIFYEGFDNFVWGGDVMKGDDGFGFSPTAETMGVASGAELTGYEDAFTEVAYSNPGTGFVQSNVWDDVSGKGVAASHQLSDSYVASRNLGEFLYLFRSQERPGYIAVGEGNAARGIMCAPEIKKMTNIGEMKVDMRVAVEANFSHNLVIDLVHAGIIKSVTLNGTALNASEINQKISGSDASFTLPNHMLNVTSSVAAAKTWLDIEFIIDGITDGSKFYISTDTASTGEHGVYIDYIKGYKVSDWNDSKNLRILYWNIQNGMISDQHNNYDNFVKWVKKWDPDICIWCESETIYKDKSGTGTSSKYLPDGWAQLCTRYGHAYAAVGGNRDNYPQTITSKYPIKTVKRITDTNVSGKPVSHGAGHFQIEVHGKKINFVTLHMWPAAHAYGVSSSKQEASAAAKEGDYYRKHEMQYIVDQTVNNSAYAGEEYWILCGDTNSHSRMDDWSTKYSEKDPTKLITHDVILNQTNLKDVIAHRDCYGEKNNAMLRCRIDFIYASPKMFDHITNSIMLMDNWCGPIKKWEYHTSFSDPSDHTPVLADFKF